MTEEEARAWLIAQFDVSRETLDGLERFVALLIDEATHQNLIAASTLPTVWSRHIVDSAQLLKLAGDARTWLDLGSGAGFPGLVIAALGNAQVTLVDSRKKRVAFLKEAARTLGIEQRVTLICSRVETLPTSNYDAISARAFAPLDAQSRADVGALLGALDESQQQELLGALGHVERLVARTTMHERSRRHEGGPRDPSHPHAT